MRIWKVALCTWVILGPVSCADADVPRQAAPDASSGQANTGFLTHDRIWGLDMEGSTATLKGITYGTVETLNIGLGTVGDTFTITDTHVGTTNVDGNEGSDVFNIKGMEPLYYHVGFRCRLERLFRQAQPQVCIGRFVLTRIFITLHAFAVLSG